MTSKGASGVTGAGFVTLAVVNPALAPGMAMAPGIDKFTSERRALADICGNGLAAIVISAPEGELDRAKLNEALADGAGVLEPAVAAAESAIGRGAFRLNGLAFPCAPIRDPARAARAPTTLDGHRAQWLVGIGQPMPAAPAKASGKSS